MPKQLETVAQVTAHILAHPRPVIFSDTCSLLDVPRGLFRDEFNPTHMSDANSLIQRAARDGGDVWLVESEQVEVEYLRHSGDEFVKVAASLERLRDAARTFLPGSQAAFCEAVNHLHTFFEELMDKAWAECLCVAHHPRIRSAAIARVNLGLAPARRANPKSIGDCLVWESFLEICHTLRAAGFADRLIFISFNKADFGTPLSPKTNLAAEMAGLSIDFVLDFSSAAALLTPTVGRP